MVSSIALFNNSNLDIHLPPSGGSASGASSTIKKGVAKYKPETDKLNGWWTMVEHGAEWRKNRRLGFWMLDS